MRTSELRGMVSVTVMPALHKDDRVIYMLIPPLQEFLLYSPRYAVARDLWHLEERIGDLSYRRNLR